MNDNPRELERHVSETAKFVVGFLGTCLGFLSFDEKGLR